MGFSGLTHLSLGDGDDAKPRIQTSQSEFLDALRRMPTLQRLDLQGPVLPEAVDGSSLAGTSLPSEPPRSQCLRYCVYCRILPPLR